MYIEDFYHFVFAICFLLYLGGYDSIFIFIFLSGFSRGVYFFFFFYFFSQLIGSFLFFI
jgi:hypothetical protein